MKIQRSLVFLVITIMFGSLLQAQHTHEDGTKHTHYSAYDSIVAHKLIFPSSTPDRVIANLTTDAAHSLAVNWRTDQQVSNGVVEIALATDGPEFLLRDVRKVNAISQKFENQNRREPLVKATYHSAVVNNLQPNTIYVYRVGNGGKDNAYWSEWLQYKTANVGEEKPFSFIYFGDAQNNVKSLWSRVIRNSYRQFPQVDFMLHAGDLINDRDANLEWGEWFYAGSFIHATVPSMMTPGNHEYRKGVLSSLWRPQFTLPENGPIESLKETCFAIDYQGMKIISLDSEGFDESKKARDAQVKWLDSVLQSNTKKWTVITTHYPVYSTAKGRDNKELREAIKPLIDKYKVDLVLQGHDHTYARGFPKNEGKGLTVVEDAGTIYAVSVSGPKMYESKDQEWMVRRGEYTQLFQIITVSKDTIKYGAYTPIGTLYDAFEITKKDGKKTLINKVPDTAIRLKKDLEKGN
ncbi:purple acid phosphatase family protein [Polaribacter sargassicola]|uniref:purple acid phosphatase family protein n=1 Tax=Polaribacter sargassicola TaxID=2836891 RepID=UPI001F46F852|nr:metallophosphoesterase family protein [Polaribacter sp. DS7-9]MCG1037418.1 fibronectin type III domain-containing protein [Polaribacter sp. DS7-9]